ncbi:DNA topoisomerase IB [Variovorax sp. OV700]|uniref:DNA topoisomerase IB n=1 Tax=Variovorax sp. OV700 TaxID=1882826 RepID=UPI0008856D3F|nr:DNA topoisomerase IB [Variovorax sp. OV700]SDI69604.1 DNA topoisomerase-1 [Variovorax sp. OV700]
MPVRSIPPSPNSPPSKPTPIANGLVYVNPDMPGIRRLKQGERFRYRDAAGRWVRDAEELSRIRMLAIPPAYTDVWICPLPNGHLQATGIDARGRKQYRYHADWRLFKDETKFERLEAFGLALPRIRARVVRDLQEGAGATTAAPGRQQVLAALVRLLDTTLLRVGNEEYASSNGSYGLTTLRNRHAAVRGAALRLRFRGKSGVMHEALLDDPRVAKVVRQCQQLPGQALFQYQEEDGQLRSVSSTDVNDYIAEASPGERFTAKDFRTWHGTVQALELTRLACEPDRAADGSRYSAKEILAAVARQLGNTPAVCKKAYVHPAVLALGSALAGDREDASSEVLRKMTARSAARRTRGLHAAEQRLLAFLRMHRQTQARELRELGRSKRASAKHSANRSAKAAPPGRQNGAPKLQAVASGNRTLSRSSATV